MRGGPLHTAAFDRSPDGLLVVDADLVIHDANPSAAALVGVDRDALPGRSLRGLPPLEGPALSAAVDRAIAGGHVGAAHHASSRPDGRPFALRFDVTPLLEAARPLALVRALDTSADLAVTAHAARGDAAAAIARVAGSVAHDLNNLLSAVLGFGELARDQTDEGSDLRVFLEHITRAGQRTRDLSQELLSFSGRQPARGHDIDLAELVHAVAPSLQAVLPNGVSLDVDGQPVRVHAEPEQLERLLKALTTNAGEASPAGGRVTVRVRARTLEAPLEAAVSPGPGRWALLTVADEGPGIPAAAHPHVFEPFFTTKPEHRGMGLAVAQGVVHRHGGAIVAYSQPGVGAELQVYLPSFDDAPAAPATGPTLTAPPRVVLVLDEDPRARTALRAGLESMGVRALAVRGRDDAAPVLAGAEVDLLLCDLALEGGRGAEVARALARDDVPTIFLSGYCRTGLLPADAVVLAKPIDLGELRGALGLTGE